MTADIKTVLTCGMCCIGIALAGYWAGIEDTKKDPPPAAPIFEYQIKTDSVYIWRRYEDETRTEWIVFIKDKYGRETGVQIQCNKNLN